MTTDTSSSSRSAERPFLDYYAANDISPVRQDVSDLQRHFDRRSSLYRSLRIVPGVVRGARVLEFGPGSGHNALYTASLGPQSYTLVDGNPRGVRDTRAALTSMYGPSAPISVVESLVEDFVVETPFDLVLAENLIPFQRDPAAFVRRIASFVAPGGVLVITCVDSVSYLAEIGRRLIAWRLAPPTLALVERVERLRPVFAPHLATLAAMSRPVDDWILDNITHPLVGQPFSIPQALAALDDGFDALGTSPEFALDLRWYKELVGDARQFNARLALAHEANVLNFLDFRRTEPAHDPQIGRDVRACCDRIYAAMQTLEASGSDDLAEVRGLLEELAGRVRSPAPSTAAAIDEIGAILAAPAGPVGAAPALQSFFGRGTQYLSLQRRPAAR